MRLFMQSSFKTSVFLSLVCFLATAVQPSDGVTASKGQPSGLLQDSAELLSAALVQSALVSAENKSSENHKSLQQCTPAPQKVVLPVHVPYFSWRLFIGVVFVGIAIYNGIVGGVHTMMAVVVLEVALLAALAVLKGLLVWVLEGVFLCWDYSRYIPFWWIHRANIIWLTYGVVWVYAFVKCGLKRMAWCSDGELGTFLEEVSLSQQDAILCFWPPQYRAAEYQRRADEYLSQADVYQKKISEHRKSVLFYQKLVNSYQRWVVEDNAEAARYQGLAQTQVAKEDQVVAAGYHAKVVEYQKEAAKSLATVIEYQAQVKNYQQRAEKAAGKMIKYQTLAAKYYQPSQEQHSNHVETVAQA